jgi:hypothetical protein
LLIEYTFTVKKSGGISYKVRQVKVTPGSIVCQKYWGDTSPATGGKAKKKKSKLKRV